MSPKRCGHLDGKEIVPRDEFVAKIRAAVDNPVMATGLGINVGGVFALTFAIGAGSAICGAAAVMAADTLMLTIPTQLGVAANLRILASFAEHVAPALGWTPNTEGPVQGDAIA